jgi:integrase/recombinase XerD
LNAALEVYQAPAYAIAPYVERGPRADQWEYWLPRWIARKAERTKQVYAEEIKRFLDFIGWKPVGTLTTVDIEEYQQMLVAQGQKPNTVGRKIATACSLVSFIHKRDQTVMPRNVGAAVERVKPDNRLADRILSEREVMKMLDAEDNPRNLALLRLLYGAGLRISEALGLRWSDVVWRDSDALVTVLGKGGKTRTVNLYGAAVAALRAIAPEAPEPSAYVFQTCHGPLGRIYAVEIIRAAARRAGIKKPVSPHWFRHASATHALERGAALPLVSRSLGHSNLATTGRYLHVRPNESLGKFLVV